MTPSLVCVLVVRTDILEERFDDLPEDQRGGLVFKRDSPVILLIDG